MAAERNLSIYAGDDYSHTITAVDGDAVAVDLSDRTWTAQWREYAAASTAVDFSVDTTNAATGVLVLSMTAAQTATLSRAGTWDLQGTYTADSAVETLLAGTVTCTKDVTRS